MLNSQISTISNPQKLSYRSERKTSPIIVFSLMQVILN